MQNNIVLIDYEEKYADIINKIEENQWGELGIGDIRKEIGEHTHIKLAKVENEIVGIRYVKKKLTNIVCECILIVNKMNAENLMKKYNFKEIMRIKEYWGFKQPKAWCKECESKPCKCTNVVFIKKII